MRIVHWLFLVSVALFVSGVGFIVAAARTTRVAAPVEAPVLKPVASVKQIMNGIVMPAAAAVWDSVSTTVSAAGVDEKVPKNDQEWAAVGDGAAALVEAGNLLIMGDRAVDRGEWVTISRAMMDAGTAALKAAEAKSPEGILAAGETIYAACNSCHEKYQRQ